MSENVLIHVAYAEDHVLMRNLVVGHITSVGNVAVDFVAQNGQELLDKLHNAVTKPEICIIDINMPVMDGYKALLEIRKRWPDIKTLILTTFSDELYVIRMMQAGANGYLVKKCTEDDIMDALTSIHEKGYYYSECANSSLFNLVKTGVKLPSFTESEIELLGYVCTELNYKEIATKMKITFKGVIGCRRRLCEKLEVSTRVELAMFAIRFGYVSLEVNPAGNNIIQKSKTKKS